MIELLRAEQIDAVLVYELSRVGRTFWDTLDAIKAIERFVFTTGVFFSQNTEPSIRRLMIGILTWVAEREREMLVQRTKDGMTRARASGKEIGIRTHLAKYGSVTKFVIMPLRALVYYSETDPCRFDKKIGLLRDM